MNRTILHSDLNGFYASVECFSNPSIRNVPVIVGGDEEMRHGIVLAKNDIAKKFGMVTGEAVWQAKRKCPGLVSVRPDFNKYLKFSRLAREIYERYTDQVESFGVDEVWADVSGSIGLFGNGKMIADEIRATIKKELGITASIGVSFNKIFSKLGSDMKKPDVTTLVTKDNYKDTAWRLPVSDLLYVGSATQKKLHNRNINTIGQLANMDVKHLVSLLGKWDVVLHNFANGFDNQPVKKKGVEAFIKSVGNSSTLHRDIFTVEDVKRVFYMLSESVATRLREHGLKATTIQIHVRDNELSSCERQAQLLFPTYLTSEIAEKVLDIYLRKYQYRNPIRSLGVRACNLVAKDVTYQLDLFTDHTQRERLESLEESIDNLRQRFGYSIVQRGILYEDGKLTSINPKDDHTIHPINYFEGAIEKDLAKDIAIDYTFKRSG
ncbi:MAG: DNA polymerase IV [Defluviitaleaceae bacterium]|nr:DNA polymerase IV [Defluviitaleaceae bacterium]